MTENPRNAGGTLPLSLRQKKDAVMGFLHFAALPALVLGRRRAGLQRLKPSHLIGVGFALLILNGLITDFGGFAALLPGSAPSGATGLKDFALIFMAAGFLQRHLRWKELKNGVIWHPWSFGVSWFEALPVKKEWIYKFVDPLVWILAGYWVSGYLKPLGLVMMFSAVACKLIEADANEKALERDLAQLAGLIESEQAAQLANLYTAGTKEQPGVKERQGASIPLSYSLQNIIAARKQEAANRKVTP